jgi:AcrR family transcriptional regulator
MARATGGGGRRAGQARGQRARTGGRTGGGGAAQASTLEPQQERSRESERKLMKAAAEVLGQHGVEGTTIPRIAAHAGLTPGAIYRRFADKDALLETVILHILERQDERMRTGMTREMTAQIPLPVFAEQLIHSLVVSYRANAALMRAMRQFAHSSGNEEFKKRVSRLEVRTFERLVDLVLASAKKANDAEMRRAIALGMIMTISTLHELVLFWTDTKGWKHLLPPDDTALRRELTQAFLAYVSAH